MLAGSADQLPYCGLGRVQDVGDVGVRVVESFAQHVCGPFVGRELLHQQQGRVLQRLASFGAEVRVRARVDWLGQPGPDVGLAPDASRLQHVDGEPGGGGRQERRRVVHGAPVVGLPAQPDTFKAYLDAVAEAAAVPVVSKYLSLLGAADVFTFDNATALIESLRIDFGELGPFGIRP